MNEELESASVIFVSDLEYDCRIVEHYELNRAVGIVGGDLFEYIGRDIVGEFDRQFFMRFVVLNERGWIL